MHQERGNFLFQALLAIGLVFAFIPFMAKSLTERNIDTRMYSATRQIETAQTAARIFIRENARDIPYETTVISGDDFSDILEPYGLPLGFMPRTAMGQDIALVVHKTPMAVSAYLEITGGNLSAIQRAELARRIGFYASTTEAGINVGIELTDIYSDIVRRNETNFENSGFLTDLDMGGFTLDNTGNIFAVRGEFETAQFDTLTISGTESGRQAKNTIQDFVAEKSVFQSKTGESALTLTRGTLFADSVNTRTISAFGDTGNFTFIDTAIYELAMVAGRTSFTGPGTWNIRGNVITSNINLSAERVDISSHINTTRGQDVYIDEESLSYNSKSGIEVGVLKTSNITLRDQTSNALGDGKSGVVIIDIRPGGTTMLPDIWTEDVNNDAFQIIDTPNADDGKTVKCADIIKEYEGAYNKQSLSQYLICQYVYWQRLEKRIDIKQCLMAGGSDCIN